MSYPSKGRAEDIRDHTARALAALIEAERDLKIALSLAKNDYEHNDQALSSIVGGLQLVTAATATDHYTWTGYAANRS